MTTNKEAKEYLDSIKHKMLTKQEKSQAHKALNIIANSWALPQETEEEPE